MATTELIAVLVGSGVAAVVIALTMLLVVYYCRKQRREDSMPKRVILEEEDGLPDDLPITDQVSMRDGRQRYQTWIRLSDTSPGHQDGDTGESGQNHYVITDVTNAQVHGVSSTREYVNADVIRGITNTEETSTPPHIDKEKDSGIVLDALSTPNGAPYGETNEGFEADVVPEVPHKSWMEGHY